MSVSTPIDRFRLSNYSYRLSTLSNWPYDGNSLCTAEKMAKSGFYRPNPSNPTTTQCFVCMKELEGWEPDDDPDKEHKSHSPKCPFLKSKQYEQMTYEEGLAMDVERYCTYLSKILSDQYDVQKVQKAFKMFTEIVLSKLPKRNKKRKSNLSKRTNSIMSNSSIKSTRSTRSKRI
ncbi:unnamed protein product [Schistosoma rodhaini]|uniref:Baculoviral IAP repeat-containing protein 5 n=3 Tax=Schistosoma TaxID=6181 RepID=A0A5K4F172_SCHMA|nr:unnamed protein product [Schistosoma rodhaini]CAH8641425.1 unnamed protein product [Schistosoma rodhaini]